MKKVLTTAIGTGIIALFIFAQIGFASQTAIESASEPTINVEPSYLKVLQGDIFTVNITVDPANEKIRGAAFKLSFNNSLLNATSLVQGTFFSGFDTMLYGEGIKPALGKIDYAEAIKGDEGEGVTKPGTIATITFEAIGERGVSKLHFEEIILSDPWANEISNITVNHGNIEIVQLSSPFLVYGYAFYEDNSECNSPVVNVTNLNTGKGWQAETNATSNYYQLVLARGIDINASETLQFEVRSPDGSQSNSTCHTLILEEINNGGLFSFNISLKAMPGIFDTGAPDNPYPSIFGTHSGTIKPSQTIVVNRIYTYPCVGTGGHTEYARIWGNSVNAHANWSGYAGDWHNLTFNTSFTLEPGKEYNYTIRTGSYPQIIHHPGEYNATGGKIICNEFTDANGKKYTGWIPAIKLWWEEE